MIEFHIANERHLLGMRQNISTKVYCKLCAVKITNLKNKALSCHFNEPKHILRYLVIFGIIKSQLARLKKIRPNENFFEFTKKFTGSKEYERLIGITDAKERIAEIHKLEIRQIYGANFSTKKPQVVFLSNLNMAFDKCNKRLPTMCHNNRILKLNLNFCSKKKRL